MLRIYSDVARILVSSFSYTEKSTFYFLKKMIAKKMTAKKMTAKKMTEGFRVPWSVRFFLRRGDPHVLPAFLKVSRLIDLSSRREASVKATALKDAEQELVERAYAGGEVKPQEMDHLGALWHRVSRRKQGRLYAIMMTKMMLSEGAPKKNALLLSKLLQLEKISWSSLLHFLIKFIKRTIWAGVSIFLQGFLYIALKIGLLSFLFHSRILGRIFDWTRLQKIRKKSVSSSWSGSFFHILIERAIVQAHHFALAHYASLKNPKVPCHLGGHGGVTYSEDEVLVFLKKQFSVKSMMDVGCGTGGQVDVARKNGIEAFGVDGDSSLKFDKPWFFIHDFTKGNFDCKRQFDLVWCVEFLEHVEEKYQPFYMALFQRANVVVCTAAPPGRSGYHHVNCRERDYWIKVFKKYGFAFDAKNTSRLRKASNSPYGFIRHRGMVFVKT